MAWLNDNSKVFLCECGSHELRVVNDEELETYWFMIYEVSDIYKEGIWGRFKAAMRLLFRGRAYSSELIFSTDELQKLKNYLVGV